MIRLFGACSRQCVPGAKGAEGLRDERRAEMKVGGARVNVDMGVENDVGLVQESAAVCADSCSDV